MAAELAIDWSAERAPELAPAAAPGESRPRLAVVEPTRSHARPSLGFVFDGAPACESLRAGLSRRQAARAPLPMEDVILFSKTIDNSAVRRASDPGDLRLLRTIGQSGFLLLVAAVLTMGPRAWLREVDAQVSGLRQQAEQLDDRRQRLRVRLAQYTDLRRAIAVAESRGYEPADARQYFWEDAAPSEEAWAGVAPVVASDGEFVSRP